jgi:hypothetical protein
MTQVHQRVDSGDKDGRDACALDEADMVWQFLVVDLVARQSGSESVDAHHDGSVTGLKLGDVRPNSFHDTGCFVAKLGLVASRDDLHAHEHILNQCQHRCFKP